ncbi:MAG: Holliday junction branch migration protein RuvA [Eggerthellaceae bacterium]|jgi:Holliday junction DNA helicase RuvA
MIAFLKGIFVGRTVGSAFIDVGGVGYEVGMSQNSLSKLPSVGEKVEVFTYLQVRDDGVSLYGFSSMEEKALFEKLITVSGVGPKVALAALSSFTPEGFAQAVADQDVARVQKIPGVGKKTASRIILELKGSLDQGLQNLFTTEAAGSTAAGDEALETAREALLSMGFTSTEVELSLKGAPEGAPDSALLQYALKRLGE